MSKKPAEEEKTTDKTENASNASAAKTDETAKTDEEADSPQNVEPAKKNKVRRRTWWGGVVEEEAPEAPKVLSWKESTGKFEAEIKRIEDMLIAETESMQAIQAQLAGEVTKLEKEVGAKQSENATLFASPKDKDTDPNELVDHLSSILLKGHGAAAFEPLTTI